jgi:TolB protein
MVNVTLHGNRASNLEDGGAYTFFVVSNNPQLQEIFEQILQLHGGLSKSSIQGQLKITIDVRQSRIKVYLFKESTKLSKLICEGPDALKTYIDACNRIIAYMFRTPGFFHSTLVFVSDVSGHSELYLSNLLFEKVVQLTRDHAAVLRPRWHPKGTHIVYTTCGKSGFPDIYCMHLASRSVTAIAQYRGINASACFSPSGKQLAMVLSVKGIPQIYISDMDGKNLHAITQCNGIKTSPIWFDQQNLIFGWDESGYGPQLYKISTLKEKIFLNHFQKIQISLSHFVDEAALNLDKNKLLFTATIHKTFQLGIWDLNSKEARFVTQGPLDHVEGCWLADGRHIVCTEKDVGKRKLVVYDTQTGKRIPLPCDSWNNTSQADALPYGYFN